MGYSLKQFKKILKEVGAGEFIKFLPPTEPPQDMSASELFRSMMGDIMPLDAATVWSRLVELENQHDQLMKLFNGILIDKVKHKHFNFKSCTYSSLADAYSMMIKDKYRNDACFGMLLAAEQKPTEPTKKQMLVQALEKIDKQAADYVDKFGNDSLTNLAQAFDWKSTPQGYIYWSNRHDKLTITLSNDQRKVCALKRYQIVSDLRDKGHEAIANAVALLCEERFLNITGSNASALKQLAAHIESDSDVIPNSLTSAIADLSYKTITISGKYKTSTGLPARVICLDAAITDEPNTILVLVKHEDKEILGFYNEKGEQTLYNVLFGEKLIRID